MGGVGGACQRIRLNHVALVAVRDEEHRLVEMCDGCRSAELEEEGLVFCAVDGHLGCGGWWGGVEPRGPGEVESD
jgi:hypothetical protein